MDWLQLEFETVITRRASRCRTQQFYHLVFISHIDCTNNTNFPATQTSSPLNPAPTTNGRILPGQAISMVCGRSRERMDDTYSQLSQVNGYGEEEAATTKLA